MTKIFRFKLLKHKDIKNKAVTIKYIANHDTKKYEFESQFKMDVFFQGEKRWLWVHKEECLFHSPMDTRAYSIPVS